MILRMNLNIQIANANNCTKAKLSNTRGQISIIAAQKFQHSLLLTRPLLPPEEQHTLVLP